MNPQYTIKNFRVFDREGATFEIAPLTVLTGCNSSGKSSMAKSLLLLDDFITKLKDEIKLTGDCTLGKHSLDFSNNKFHLQLGRFDVCLNKKAEKYEAITFSYEFFSKFCFRPLTVVYTFKTDPNDELNNGSLYSIEIKQKEGKSIFELKIGDKKQKSILQRNLHLLKDSFIDYSLTYYNHQMHGWLFHGRDLRGSGVEKDISFRNAVEPFLKELKEKRTEDFFRDNPTFVKSLESKSIFFNLIKEMISKHIIFVVPILNDLDGVSKKDIRSKFDFSVYNEKEFYDETIKRYLLEEIISDFEKSEYESFIDYYRFLEDIHFDNDYHDFHYSDRWGRVTPLTRSYYGHIDDDFNLFCSILEKLQKLSGHISGEYIPDMTNLDTPEGGEWIIKNLEKNKGTFPIDYQLVMNILRDYSCRDRVGEYLKEKRNIDTDEFYTEHFDPYGETVGYSVNSVDVFQDYCVELFKDAIAPSFLGKISYVGSDKATVRRLYSLSDQSNAFDKLLLNYLQEKKVYAPEKQDFVESFSPGAFINE